MWTAPMPQMLVGRSAMRVDVRDAPLDVDTAHLVQHLVEQVQTGPYGPTPALNTYQYGVGVYTVADQPYVPVGFRDEQNKRYLPDIFKPATLATPGGSCSSIPIPADAVPSPGTDAALTIYEPATRRLWNLWRARRDTVTGAWSAVWAGRIDDVALSDGRFPGYEGCSASGLVTEELVVGIAEAQLRNITHAIGLAIPDVARGANSYPATRNDGVSTRPRAIHEGRRFRLPADLDLSTLRTTPDWAGKTYAPTNLCLDIAAAVKKYGFIISDRSVGVSIGCEMGTATKIRTGVDPWPILLQGKPNYVAMDGFPWQLLQALPMDWGKPTV